MAAAFLSEPEDDTPAPLDICGAAVVESGVSLAREKHHMSLKQDMELGIAANNNNFTCLLLRLFQKADLSNRSRLTLGFPNAAEVFNAWQFGDTIPNLPYDGH